MSAPPQIQKQDSLPQQQQPLQQKSAAWEEIPAVPSGKQQMAEFPDGSEPLSSIAHRPHHANFLKKFEGENRNNAQRAQFRRSRLEQFGLAQPRQHQQHLHHDHQHHQGTDGAAIAAAPVGSLTSQRRAWETNHPASLQPVTQFGVGGAQLRPGVANTDSMGQQGFVKQQKAYWESNQQRSGAHQPFGTTDGGAFDGLAPSFQPHDAAMQRQLDNFGHDQQRSTHLLGDFEQQREWSQRSLLEQRLLSKPPLRHWGFEPALVYQPNIDQRPNFTRTVRFQPQDRVHALIRIREMQGGVAWSIPVYNEERKTRGGTAWTVELDSDFYPVREQTRATKQAKAGKKRGVFYRLKKIFASGRSSRWVEPLPPPPLARTHGVAAKEVHRRGAVLPNHNNNGIGNNRVAVKSTRDPAIPVRDRKHRVYAPRKATPGSPTGEILVARPYRLKEQHRIQLVERPVGPNGETVVQPLVHGGVGTETTLLGHDHALPASKVPLVRQAPAETAISG